MPPFQQKFTVIPDLQTGRSNGSDNPTGPPSRPPMTSKQAKKLYKAANKGPKLSKAEQRRQDLFEQDQIRKEFEKEKNQARAKASRDKRREKEEKEKAAKRKKGLPLVDVHPSQDTLARFVRPPPKPKPMPKDEPALLSIARQDDDSDFTLPAESDAERPSKRRKTITPNPEPEAQEKQEPSFVGFSRSVKRQVTSSPAPLQEMPKESKIERPSKRQKSSSPPHKEEAQWAQRQSLARYPGSARPKRSSSPIQQEQVPKDLEPTRTDSSPPKSPKQHVVLPPQLISRNQGPMEKPSDYDADAAEILDLLAQQIANESFSHEDFLLADGPVVQSRSKAPVSKPTLPRLVESPRPQRIRSNITSERPGLDDPNPSSQTRRTPPQTLRGQASRVVDILDQKQAPTKESTVREVLTRTGGGMLPDTTSQMGIQNRPVPKSLHTESNPPRPVENLTPSAANPPKPTRSSPWASASSKPVSRVPLRDVSSNPAPQMRAGNDKGSAIKEPSHHIVAVSKKAQPVFRKPDLPRSASKTSCKPRTPCMGPPPGPPQFKTPAYQSSGLSGNMPKFLPKASASPGNQPAVANTPERTSHAAHTPAPSSTQLFLSGLEDFFPSPSQELKEIFDDSSCTHRGLPAYKKAQREPSRPMPPPKTNITRTSPAASPKLERKPTQRDSLCTAQSPVMPAVPTCASAAPKISANQSNQNDWVPPFSTQDFFFSSQDLREVEEDTSSSATCQLLPAEGGMKPTLPASFSLGHTIAESPALPVVAKQPLVRGGGTRPTRHKPETVVLVASNLCDSQDPWLNMSSQRSKSSLPETPTGAKGTSVNSAFEPHTTQKLGHTTPGGDRTPSKRHVDDNSSSAEAAATDGSPVPKQPSLSSSRPNSPQKSLDTVRPSPKPFFTSSGTKELTLLAIEKSKRTARDDEFERRRRQDMEATRQRFAQRRREMEEAKREEEILLAKEEAARLAREEEARLAREEAARLVLFEQQDKQGHVGRPLGRPTEDDQESSELEDDDIDQLLLESALDGGLMAGGPAQGPELEDDDLDRLLLESALDGGLMPIGSAPNKTSPPGIFSTRKPTGNAGGLRSRSEGSFEKMMALAHKKGSRRGNAAPAETALKHQAPVTASQETDYGDAEWDECDLNGFL